MIPWLPFLGTVFLILFESRKASAQQVAINSYAPVNVTCPSRSLLRSSGTSPQGNQTINAQEALYVENRRINSVASAFETFLANNKTGYDLTLRAPNASYCELEKYSSFGKSATVLGADQVSANVRFSD